MNNKRLCSKSQDQRHNFAGGVCTNFCGVRQEDLMPQKKIDEGFNFETYLAKKMQESKDTGKARNYMEEIAWRYVPSFNWTNERFFEDYKAFWMACNMYFRSHTPYEFEQVLKWGADKKVFPMAVVKVLLRKKQIVKRCAGLFQSK